MIIDLKGYKCNWCNNVALDYINITNWIHIDNRGLHIYDEKGNSKVFEDIAFQAGVYDSLDFCSFECFIKWLIFNHEDSYQDMEFDLGIDNIKLDIIKKED